MEADVFVVKQRELRARLSACLRCACICLPVCVFVRACLSAVCTASPAARLVQCDVFVYGRVMC